MALIEVSVEELEGRLNIRAQYWQSILRLQDWDVKVHILRRHEMKNEDAIGTNVWDLNRKASIISVCSPEDLAAHHDNFDGEECDYDVTLVHELLHLHYAPFWESADDSSRRICDMEQSINLISYALVALDRKEVVNPTPAEAVDEVIVERSKGVGAYL